MLSLTDTIKYPIHSVDANGLAVVTISRDQMIKLTNEIQELNKCKSIVIGQDDFIHELELQLEDYEKYKEVTDSIVKHQSLVIINRENRINLLEERNELNSKLIDAQNNQLKANNRKLLGWKIATASGAVLCIGGIVTAIAIALK